MTQLSTTVWAVFLVSGCNELLNVVRVFYIVPNLIVFIYISLISFPDTFFGFLNEISRREQTFYFYFSLKFYLWKRHLNDNNCSRHGPALCNPKITEFNKKYKEIMITLFPSINDVIVLLSSLKSIFWAHQLMFTGSTPCADNLYKHVRVRSCAKWTSCGYFQGVLWKDWQWSTILSSQEVPMERLNVLYSCVHMTPSSVAPVFFWLISKISFTQRLAPFATEHPYCAWRSCFNITHVIHEDRAVEEKA